MDPAIWFVAAALLVIGLVGQGFEMKKIRASIITDEQLNPQNVFTDKRNFKWYVIIAAGLILGYAANANM